MSRPEPRFPHDRRLLVLLVVGLRPRDLHLAPYLSSLAAEGRSGPLRTHLPAVTCAVQASMLTGRLPREHGIVGNGWYFRDLSEVMFWRQSRQLVQAEEIYDLGRATDPGYRAAKLFWWFNMYAGVTQSVTPRPQYFANGLKRFGLYSEPPELERDLVDRFGEFPFFNFWGPAAGLPSSEWIARSAAHVIESADPHLALVYLPHLDYDHQRYGPEHALSQQAVRDVDAVASPLIEKAREKGYEVLVCSEYGIEPVDRPVFLNRGLREAGMVRIQETAHGELLDCGASDAFAVVDHQVAHVYVRTPGHLASARTCLEGIEGVARVLDREAQKEHALDHERSGDLVVLAERGCWFAYHYWLDEKRRPDFAPTVDIHRKPGYDPAELFVDPKIRFPRLRMAQRLLQKKLGFRYLMDLIPTDPSQVRGSHGLLPSDPELGPLYLATPGLELPARPGAHELLFRHDSEL